MTSITKQLREVGELLGLDCGDNSCLFASEKTGMRTNGGCQCDLVDAVMQVKDTAMHAEAYSEDCETLEAELKRFREREQLVMDLALMAFGCAPVVDKAGAVQSAEALQRMALAVRDFKVIT